jgi:succinate dehydrogenase/fumarate reductase flavoprotein subunit
MMTAKLEQIADEVIKTDFLVIGGGLSGCMAAIRAKRKGNIDVAVMERASIKYGGDSIGVDDHSDWRPEYYKSVIMHPVLKGFPARVMAKRPKAMGPNRLRGGSISWDLAVNEAKNYAKALVTLEEIGVNMLEDDGTLKIRQETTVPGMPHWHPPVPGADGNIDADWIMYRGTDLKQKLASAVMKSGARIFERTLLTSLITKDGTAVGAMGLNTRTGKLLVFRAKTILMSTGGIRRIYLYPYAPFPNNLFYSRSCTGNHGGGVAAAFRAGAKLSNLEYIYLRIVAAGACTTSGAGGGWYWDLKNSRGEHIDMWAAYSNDMEAPPIERDVLKFDRGSVNREAVIGCYFTAATEYPRALKFHKLAGGMEQGAPIEVRPFLNGITHGGILPVNGEAESSIKNLFVAGDASCGLGDNGTKAIVWGFIIGDHVRELAPELNLAHFTGDTIGQVQAEKKRVFAPMGSKGDVDPLELEDYVRTINMNYIGVRKIGSRLKRAVEIMRITGEKFAPALKANDPHELMRALEVQDIIDLSELHAQFSLLRTESRDLPNHYRIDYPKQDDEHWQNTIITAQKQEGEEKYEIERTK